MVSLLIETVLNSNVFTPLGDGNSSDGVYFYLLTGVMLGGTEVKKQGFITLIRGD
jgi:hypothetical protein